MKIFPKQHYKVKLSIDGKDAMSKLKRETLHKDLLISEWTKKVFVGQVFENEFRLISSKVGRGAICVLIGEFKNKQGTIEIKVHDAFKVMFSILMLMPVVAFGITVYYNGFYNSIGIIIPVIMGFLFVRFAFLELIFKIVSKNGIKRLTQIIEIETIERVVPSLGGTT